MFHQLQQKLGYDSKCCYFHHGCNKSPRSSQNIKRSQLISNSFLLSMVLHTKIPNTVTLTVNLTSIKMSGHINPSSTNVLLIYLVKTSENLRFFDVLRGYRSGILVENGLRTCQTSTLWCFTFFYFQGKCIFQADRNSKKLNLFYYLVYLACSLISLLLDFHL